MANLSNINNKFIVTDGNNGRVLIGATNDIGATLFANHPSTTAPSLTFNAPAGQVFENEDLQIAFGLNNASPYNGYMQTRFVSAPYYRNLAINPLGGDVGIGTNSPAGKFNSYISATRQITHNGNGGDLSIISDNNSSPVMFIKGTGSADLLNVFDNTTEVFTILDGGNVGIGETDPNGKLDIKQNMTAGTTAAFTDPHLRLSANNTVDNTGFVGMTFATSTANNYGFSWGALRTTSALGGMHLRYHGNSASGTDIFNIDYVGNVTIASTRYIRSDSSGGYLTIQGGATYPGGRIDMYGGSNASAGIQFLTGGATTSPTERMRIYEDGDVTMGQYSYQEAPTNGILKIRTSGSTANVCYPLLYVGGSTHLATRQYGIGFDPEGYVDRMKMFFGVDGMGNGYSFGDFVWNINTVVDSSTVTPSDEKMRLDKGGDLKLKTGNLAITNTSKGILLGGTGTANQLRIYQHGTWAPQIYYQNATDQANATNTTQVGLYTRIGNICMVQFRLVWNQASGTPAVDNIGIKNLPFQGSTTNTYAEVPCILIGYTGGPSPRGNLTLTLPGANSPIALFNDTNNVGNMGNAIGSGTKEIRFSFTYTTN